MRIDNAVLGQGGFLAGMTVEAATGSTPQSPDDETRTFASADKRNESPDSTNDSSTQIESSVQTFPADTELKFHVDQENETIQVEFIDPAKGKTTQKIPSDEALRLHASLRKQVGVLMNRDL